MQVNRTPWKRECKDKKTVGGDRGRDWVPCGLQKPPNLHPIIREREGEACWEFGSKGEVSQTHTPTVTPSSSYIQCWTRERGSYKKEEELGVLVLHRAREGGCCRGLGRSLGWSHTCTVSPRSQWSAAGTGPAMRTPQEGNELCAPSSPPRRWGIASSSPRPSPVPGQRAACANVCFQCQKSIRGRTLSGHPNRCLDQLPKVHQGKHKPSGKAKVQTREQNMCLVMKLIENKCQWYLVLSNYVSTLHTVKI